MDCRHLNSIPKGVTRLRSLRRLGLFNTPLRKVPKCLGRLEHLNDISGFVVGDEDNRGEGCDDLEELNSLSELRKLSIFNLERASNGAPVLFHKSHLTKLAMLCTPYSRRLNGRPYTEDEITRVERIFDELRPPPCLEEELWIDGFFGRRFPSWMMSSLGTSFPQLTRLFLLRFELCQQLPPLGQLPQLKYLRIAGARELVSIGHEFLRDEAQRAASTILFPKLEIFWIEDMPNWETWSLSQELRGSGHDDDDDDDAIKDAAAPQSRLQLPRLRELVLRNCPKLRALPEGAQHANSDGMQSVRSFPALSRLTLDSCPALEYVENPDALEYLKLVDDSVEHHRPQWMPQLIQGRRHRFKMDIFCHLRMLQRCLHDGPDWPIIREIPVANFYSYQSYGRASLHQVKEPSHYQTTNV